nr:RNA-dependent RNA polymerase [Aspergillus fumigatus mitovirus 1]
MVSAVKSCNRLFDEPCSACDPLLFEEATEDFLNQMAEEGVDCGRPAPFSGDPVGLLRRVVRRIIGRDWGRYIDRRARIPNQRGCFDSAGGWGGTLSGKPWECQDLDCGRVRSSVAKTKGKARVVTLQNSYVKEVLRPIHEGLYDALSKKDWLVRGELTEDHLRPLVKDRREGEDFISGDYSQATNLISRKATLAVVEVLLESDHLEPEEKRVLWESFEKITHVNCETGRETRLKRGQMMGSYLSFPILCILNRAFYLIARYGNQAPKVRECDVRPARFNGDDCAFCGDESFYAAWVSVTAHYGMVVNHEKTGRSTKRIELNSRVFFVEVDRFAAKPVLSFLACKEDSLLLETLHQTQGLRYETRVWIINHLLLPEIRVRDVTPEALPLGIFRRLVRKAWFRKAIDNERTTKFKPFSWNAERMCFERSFERKIEMVVGPCPKDEYRDWFDERYRDCEREFLERERGRKVRVPYDPWYRFKKPNLVDRVKGTDREFALGKREWAWMWPRSLLDWVKSREPWRLVADGDKLPVWFEDHPFLHLRRKLIRRVKRRAFPPYLPGEWIRENRSGNVVLAWQGLTVWRSGGCSD